MVSGAVLYDHLGGSKQASPLLPSTFVADPPSQLRLLLPAC